MKRRVLCVAMALAMALSGCASMLQQTYVSVTPHDKQPAAEADSSAVRVEDYPQLVSAILYLVAQGEEEGVIRLHNHWQNAQAKDVQADLTGACDEVSREDPLGAYAVDFIKTSDVKRIVTYYEATVSISYRRTPAQTAAIVPVIGSGAIRAELAGSLAAFAPETALRVNYFSGDADYIKSLVTRAYYDTPAAAQGLPKVGVALYPESGAQRIVEVTLAYPAATETLKQQSAETTAAAEQLVQTTAKPGDTDELRLGALFEALRLIGDGTGTHPTSHAALVSGGADSEGMALGFKLLCDLAGLDCQVAQGTDADGVPHFWAVVALGEEHRHVDTSSPDGFLLSDRALAEAGIVWNQEDYPPCGEPPEERETALAPQG